MAIRSALAWHDGRVDRYRQRFHDGHTLYSPLSLAVLIFYTFPFTVAPTEALLEQRTPSTRLVVALAGEFTGLALVLGLDFSDLDWHGLGFGLWASLSSIPLFLCARRLVLKHDAITIAGCGSLTALVLMLLFLLLSNSVGLPGTIQGWSFLIVACGFFASAFLLQLYAVRNASAGSAAMVFNAEPLLTIVIAWLFLGETLGGLQWIGVALALGAIFFPSRPQELFNPSLIHRRRH